MPQLVANSAGIAALKERHFVLMMNAMEQETRFHLGHTELSALQWLPQNKPDIKVLAIHGWLDNAASFSQLATRLNRWSWLAVDLAGHGHSQHRPHGAFYHLWDYVLDIAALLNTFQQSVWLVGHSMGASVAMMVATVMPDKVRGLILLDGAGPVTATPEERVGMMKRSVLKMIKMKNKSTLGAYASVDEMIKARMNGLTPLSYDAAADLVKRSVIEREDGYSWRSDPKLTFPSPFRMDEPSVAAFIQEVKCPTLALMARQGIYQRHETQAKQRLQHFPWAREIWLDGGHHFHLESSTVAPVAAEIQQFVDQN